MFFGAAIIIIGFIFLLQNLGLIPGSAWQIVWPCLIILLGLSMICKSYRCCGWEKHRMGGKSKEKDE